MTAELTLRPVALPLTPLEKAHSETQAEPAKPETVAIAEAARLPTLLVAGELVIEIDEAAQRFVNKLFDPETRELTRQFPSDNQLAFSRGLNAYLRAMFG